MPPNELPEIATEASAFVKKALKLGLYGGMSSIWTFLIAGREPVSGLDLAIDTVKAIYAAYLSAEKGMRVELDKI